MRPKYMIDGAYDRFEFVLYAVPQTSSKVSSYLVLANNQKVNVAPFESEESESSSLLRLHPPRQEQTIEGSASSSPAPVSWTIPSALISIEIGWTLLEQLWRQWLLPWPAVMIALILWVFAEPLTASNSLLGSYGVKVEYVRYSALFLMAIAFKIAEKGKT
jgi:hypothetical protein